MSAKKQNMLSPMLGQVLPLWPDPYFLFRGGVLWQTLVEFWGLAVLGLTVLGFLLMPLCGTSLAQALLDPEIGHKILS